MQPFSMRTLPNRTFESETNISWFCSRSDENSSTSRLVEPRFSFSNEWPCFFALFRLFIVRNSRFTSSMFTSSSMILFESFSFSASWPSTSSFTSS